jgi:prepilin-type N-terminal cleavage/methylation domain-containing protein
MLVAADIDNSSSDDGFGLVEIVVSIFILAILSLALLPLLINGVKQTTKNVTLAAATQLVDKQIDLAQSSGSTCATITSALGSSATSTDSRGVSLVMTTGATCPATVSSPSTLTVTVKVTRGTTGPILAQASTLVYING